MNSFRQIKLLADFLDQQGKVDQPISVIGTRAYLGQEFKAESPGGPLKVGAHELQVGPACRARQSFPTNTVTERTLW